MYDVYSQLCHVYRSISVDSVHNQISAEDLDHLLRQLLGEVAEIAYDHAHPQLVHVEVALLVDTVLQELLDSIVEEFHCFLIGLVFDEG